MRGGLPVVDRVQQRVQRRGWWRVAQVLAWGAGFGIYLSLFLAPAIGLRLFWNVLIPIAPVLIVVAVGAWRNLCPMASVVLLPRHLGLSRRRALPLRAQAWGQLASVVALFLIVPARHAIFNTNGPATGVLITVLALCGIAMGMRYEWKSAWCSTLCPVHPVERLYGSNVVASMPNAHCDACWNCVVPCPDSTPNMQPLRSTRYTPAQLAATLITGGLPGFVWGWFQVPDQHGVATASVYLMPLAGLTASLLLYLALVRLRPASMAWLGRVFAACAVSCYYAYRIPELLGYGPRVADGLLIDARNVLPHWVILTMVATSTAFFGYWLVLRPLNGQSWSVRPRYGKRR